MRNPLASIRNTPARVRTIGGLAVLCVLVVIGAGVFWNEEVAPLDNGSADRSYASDSAAGAKPDVSDLLAWYPMEEAGTATTRADAHGTTDYSNVVAAASRAVTGLVGNALELGSGDFRTTNATPAFPLDVTRDFTIVTWVYTPFGASGHPYLWRTGGGPANVRIQARLAKPDYLLIVETQAGVGYVINRNDFAFDTWQMVTLRHEASTNTVRLRVNMNTGVSDTLAAPLVGPSAEEVRIEGNRAPVRLDEQSVWQVYLSDEELAWLYNGGAGRAYGDLAHTTK